MNIKEDLIIISLNSKLVNINQVLDQDLNNLHKEKYQTLYDETIVEIEKHTDYIINKHIDWLNDYYTDVDWNTFNDTYFKCDKCKSYLTEQCMCYTR